MHFIITSFKSTKNYTLNPTAKKYIIFQKHHTDLFFFSLQKINNSLLQFHHMGAHRGINKVQKCKKNHICSHWNIKEHFCFCFKICYAKKK